MVEKFSGRISCRAAWLQAVNFVGFVIVSVMLSAAPLRADTYNWIVPFGDWSNAGFWLGVSNSGGMTLPASSDIAYVVNGGTVNVTQLGATCGTLSLGSGKASGAVDIQSGALSTYVQIVGNSGVGSFQQEGGNNVFGYALQLGVSADANGIYNLSGGELTCAYLGGPETIGYGGTGSFTQTNGYNYVAFQDRRNNPDSDATLYLGYSAGANGIYNLLGGYLLTGSTQGNTHEYIGYSGTGTFVQTGGDHVVLQELDLGYNARSCGTYSLSGTGVLSAPIEKIACDPTASALFQQSGGSNNTSAVVIGSGGTLQVSGGTLQVNGPITSQGVLEGGGTGIISLSGSSILDLSQGTLMNTSKLSLIMGADSLVIVPAGFNTATGFSSYQTLGLTHTAGTTLVVPPGQGFTGGGSISDPVNCQGSIISMSPPYAPSPINLNNGLTLSGTGSVSVQNVTINDTTSAMNSGLLSVSGTQYIGFSGKGSFAQSGGTNIVTGTAYYSFSVLALGCNAGDSGTYNLSGSGMLVATSEYIGYSGSGNFTQTGGSNTCNRDIVLGYSACSSGTYSLSRSGYLSATSETAGSAGTGTFIQSGGTNICGNLDIGDCNTNGNGGLYILSGSGLLSAQYEGLDTYVFSRGTFTQSGGTNNCKSLSFGGMPYGGDGIYNLNGGVLLLSGLQYFSGTSATLNFSGGTMEALASFSGNVPMTLGTSGGGAIFDTAGYSVTLSGSLSGPGNLTKVDSGTLILATTNSYSGNTLVSGGTLALSSPLALQNSTLDTSGSGTLSFGSLTSATLGGLSGPGVLTLANSSSQPVNLSVGNNGTSTTFVGMLQGAGSFIKVGSGTLTLATSNTYTGTTFINGGILSLANSAALSGGGNITFGGGTLQYTNSNGNDYSGVIAGSTGPISIDTNGLNITIASSLTNSNSGGLRKIGSGTLTLAVNNNYMGTTFINGGVLSLANSAALPGNGNITFGGGTLQYTNSNSNDYSSYIVNSKGPISIDTNGLNITFASNVTNSNSGGLTKIGSGSLTLANANTFSGNTMVSGGTLALGSALALQQSTLDSSGSGSVSFGSLTAVTLGGLTGQGALSLSNAASGAVAVTVGQNNTSTTYSGMLTGAASLTKVGYGTLTLSGTNTYTGQTLINSGALSLANPLAVQNSTVNVSSSGALPFAAGNTNPTLGGLAGTGNAVLATATAEPVMLDVGQNGQSTTYSGNLSGAGGLTKVGTGTLTLTNVNSYSGPTVIQGGILRFGFANPETGISMQWSTGSQYAITSGTAGAFGLSNWNFSTSLTGVLSSVVDNTDTSLPGTSITWTAQGGPYSNGGKSDSNIHKLLSGGLESQSTTVGSSYIMVTGVPYPSYNVYVYVSGWDPTRTGYMEIYQNAAGYTAGKQVGFQAFQNSSQGSLTTYVAPTTGLPQLTDVLFSAVSGSILTIDWQKNSDNVMVSAIQIVGTHPALAFNFLPIATPLTIAADATLDLGGGSQQVASLSDYTPGSGGSIINSSSAASLLTLSPTGGSTTFSGMIPGGGSLGMISLVMSGSGTQVLAGNNSFTGSTTINGGLLKVGAANSLSPNSNVLINGGTLDATAFSQKVQSLTVGSSGSLNLSMGSLFTSSNAAKLGGRLNLFGAATAATEELISYPSFSGSFSSTSLNSGSMPKGYSLLYTPRQLDLVLNQFIPAGNSLNWSDSSNWTFGTASNGASQPAVLNASTTSAVTVTLDEPVTLGTLVLGNSGSTSAGYSISGSSANTLAFNNASHGSTIALTDGSHAIDAPVVLADSLTIASGGTNAWTLSFGSASSIAQSGTGSYSLTMNGASGTLILSGSDTYSGGTNVEAGMLIVTNSEAIPDGTSVTVGAGASSILGASNAPAAVPEPSTFVLLSIGAIGLAGYVLRRKRTQAA
jgi:autotransporter-associated beta strand protein